MTEFNSDTTLTQTAPTTKLSLNHDKLILTFPYDVTLVQMARGIPMGRKWNKANKYWEVALNEDNLNYVLKSFNPELDMGVKFLIESIEKKKQKTKELQQLTDVKETDTAIQFPEYQFKTQPFKHQRIGLKWGIETEKHAYFYEMGTGKSFVVINVINYRKLHCDVRRVLVICPNSITYTWQEEIKKHSNLNSIVLQGTAAKRKELLKKDTVDGVPIDIYIINYEGLLVIGEELLQSNFDIIVADESQKLKNGKAKRTKIAVKLASQVKYRYILTGTPITQNPLDIFSQYLFLDSGETFGSSFFAFRGRYCVDIGRGFPNWQPIAGTFEEINAKIYQKASRFLKKDCLDLPPKIYEVQNVELTSEQKTMYEDMRKDLIAEFGEKEVVATIVLTQLLRLSQITSGFYEDWAAKDNPKLKLLGELLEDLVYNDEGGTNDEGETNTEGGVKKVVIWARFRKDIQAIAERFKKYSPALIYGEVKDKQAEVEKFQNDKSCKILIGQPQSGGLGLTLTAADTTIYYSQGFSLEERMQSEDRCHRVGAEIHNKVTYIDLVAKNTIDEQILKDLKAHKNVAAQITENWRRYVE